MLAAARQARHSAGLPRQFNRSPSNPSPRFSNLNGLSSNPSLNHNNLSSLSCPPAQEFSKSAVLRQWFENHQGLVGSRDYGFSNGNQLFLLVEDAQPRGHRRPPIELRCRAGRRLRAPRLQL